MVPEIANGHHPVKVYGGRLQRVHSFCLESEYNPMKTDWKPFPPSDFYGIGNRDMLVIRLISPYCPFLKISLGPSNPLHPLLFPS